MGLTCSEWRSWKEAAPRPLLLGAEAFLRERRGARVLKIGDVAKSGLLRFEVREAL